MEIGIGLDGTLGLSYDEQAQLSAEAARLGYTSIWTPEGAGEDSFLLCSIRWAATREVVAGGLTTGIGVSPVGLRTPMGFAMSAGTMSKLTGGRFILGIGAGGAYTPQYRRTWNVRGPSPPPPGGRGGARGGAGGGAARPPPGHRPAATDARLPGGAGAGDAAPGRRAGGRALAELVHGRAGGLEPGARRRGRGAGRPRPGVDRDRRVHPRLRRRGRRRRQAGVHARRHGLRLR